MKTIKIFVVPSHQTKERTSGVDFVRVLQPMKYLDGYSDGEVEFKVDFFDIHSLKPLSWVEIAQQYDLVFLNYTVLDWQYAAMGACMRGKDKKIIMDLDDAIWHVEADNVVHDEIKKMDGPFKITCMLNDVDLVTTTNGYLRNVIMDKTVKGHHQIKVVPNMVDLSLYNHISPAKDNGVITLMHFGSTSHFEDLLEPKFLEGMDRIMKDYPNVKFKTVGSFLSQLKYKWGARYENAFGDVDIYKWIKDKFPTFMDECDIMVVPLRDTLYNRCKSDIKFIESASAKKPGVFSDTRPYHETIKHNQTGFLCSTADDWYNSLKVLIENIEERRRIGENAYNFVVENRQIKDHIKDYADFIKSLF